MLLRDLEKYHIILASGSPRRQSLLRDAGISFDYAGGFDVDESFPEALRGEEIPMYLAEKKSMAYPFELGNEDIVITADTIVFQDGEVLHKPGSKVEAIEILRKISGNAHHVYTGVCIRSSMKKELFVSDTKVVFGILSEEEIRYYIQEYKPFDKAGAYGIQEWIGFVGVEEIRGSYFNVMGLPVHSLYRKLETFIK